MKRKVMTLDQIRAESYLEDADQLGIGALVDVENMGFCKDGVTKWYFFQNAKGEDCVYFHRSVIDQSKPANFNIAIA